MFFKVLKRIIIFISIVCFLTVVIFVSSKPKVVKAEPFSIALGITALVAAGLAAGGISMSTNASSGASLQQGLENLAQNFQYAGKTLQDWYNISYDDYVDVIKAQYKNDYVITMRHSLADWISHFRDYIATTFNMSGVASTLYSQNFLDCKSGKYSLYTQSEIDNNIANLKTTLPILEAGNSQEVVFNDHFSVTIDVSKYYNRFYRVTVKQFTDGVETSSLANSIGEYDPLNAHKIFFVLKTGANAGIGIMFCVNTSQVWTVNIPQSKLDGVVSDNISIDGSLADGYQDYEDAMDQALSDSNTADGVVGVNVGAQEGVSAEDIINSYLDKIVSTGTVSGTLTGGYADERTAEEETDGERVPFSVDLASSIVVIDGLHRFFPFCIPWDLYDLVEKFNVEPEAPEFDLNIGFAGIWDEETIHIDFSPFETVALILRVLIIISFALFLIIKTRDLIRG